MQQYAVFIYCKKNSTCFGCLSHPSSGVHQTVTAASGTGHITGPMAYGPDGLFVSHRTGSHSAGIHVPFTNCFVCRWFCVVHDPKPPLHSHNWLSFGKFQDTEKNLGEILYLFICSFLPCLSWLLRSWVRKSRRDLWITLYFTSVNA